MTLLPMISICYNSILPQRPNIMWAQHYRIHIYEYTPAAEE